MIREPMTATTHDGPLRVELQYDEAEPFAVSLDFLDAGETWIFARDLLIVGCRSAKGCGRGDVRVSVHPSGGVSVLLSSPDGELCLRLPLEETRWFVERTLTAIPRGTECVDLDDLIKRLVAS